MVSIPVLGHLHDCPWRSQSRAQQTLIVILSLVIPTLVYHIDACVPGRLMLLQWLWHAALDAFVSLCEEMPNCIGCSYT